jgi:hypothetical protein
MRYNSLLIISIFLLVLTSCDNTEIEPQFRKITLEEDKIDSVYSSIKLYYSGTGQSRILRVKNTQTTYDFFTYSHKVNFTDGSWMNLQTTYKFGTNDRYNAVKGSNVSGYQGYYACMEFYDKLYTDKYDFRDKSNSIFSNPTLLNNKYVVINIDNITFGWPGYAATRGTISGAFTILK